MISFVRAHPNLTAWLVLAVVMVATLLYASKDVGLQPAHMLVMIASTVCLAGLCVWIINWE